MLYVNYPHQLRSWKNGIKRNFKKLHRNMVFKEGASHQLNQNEIESQNLTWTYFQIKE